MNKRVLNIVLSGVFFVLLIAMPIRTLLFTELADNARGQGTATASYIMIFLFGGLTLIFAYRAIKAGPSKERKNEDEDEE